MSTRNLIFFLTIKRKDLFFLFFSYEFYYGFFGVDFWRWFFFTKSQFLRLR